jgi:cytoskeletal protein RodZ
MLFEKKKIKIETLSEYLTEVRLGLNLSLQEVVKKTAIKPQFLNSLESGDFKSLPADVYVLGFLKQLSALYFINPDILIGQYKKERGIQQQLAKQTVLNGVWYKKYFKKVVITPKLITLALGLAFVALTVGYIIWQVWSINKTPALEILQPTANAVISDSSVLVEGKTDPAATLTINGQAIFVDSQGDFQSQLGLTPGPKEIIITATNRFGKAESKTINITAAAPADSGQPAILQLKINFTSAVTLGFAIDGQPQQTLSFNSGDSKVFTANQEIVLSTSDAGATKVTLNGEVLGPMGRPNEALDNVPFFAQSPSTSPVSK